MHGQMNIKNEYQTVSMFITACTFLSNSLLHRFNSMYADSTGQVNNFYINK